MVKDGHTIVIGGLFRESSDSGRSQVPFLGNLPLAGAAVPQADATRTMREEVIILLTPHIVKDDAAYADAVEEELQARRAAARRRPQGHDAVGPRAPGRGALRDGRRGDGQAEPEPRARRCGTWTARRT